MCDANNLYRAYIASIRSSKWKETTQKYQMNYLRNITYLQEKLVNQTLQNGAYREFYLSERGKIRAITSIGIDDRVVRHVLCDQIFLPIVRNKIIYDNCASLKDRGLSMQRKRFEVHLRRFYKKYRNDGWILFGDFSKFYDNIWHETAKNDLAALVENDEYILWLLDLIFDVFKIDVSYMSDKEYATCYTDIFDKNKYRKISDELKTGSKWMDKSLNIGDQLSQVIGIYYANPIDTYVKYVKQQKYYGRYCDDWYIISHDKEELIILLDSIKQIAEQRGIHINYKKTKIVKMSNSFKFLQIRYTVTQDGKVLKKINPKRVTAMRRKLKKLANKVKDRTVAYENVENMFNGWMCNHYKLLSKQQRKNLISLYEELFKVKITIIKKKMYFTKEIDH